jgi:hypothetical protein
MTSRERVLAVVQQVAQPSDEVLDHFRVDAVDLGRTFNTQASDWADYTLPDVPPQNIVAMFEAVDEYR